MMFILISRSIDFKGLGHPNFAQTFESYNISFFFVVLCESEAAPYQFEWNIHWNDIMFESIWNC